MEKLVCTSCGATITPNTTEPFLTCEYCDSSITNAFYVEPAPKPANEEKPQDSPAAQTVQETSVEEEANSPVSTLVEAVGGVARTLLQRSLINRSLQRSVKQRPIIQRTNARPTVQHVRPPRPSVAQPRPHMQHPHGMRRAQAGGPGRPMGGPGRGRKP